MGCSCRPSPKYSLVGLVVHGFEIDRVQSINRIRSVALLGTDSQSMSGQLKTQAIIIYALGYWN